MYGVEFRPLDFSSVLGLDTIKELLQKILKKDKLDSAYLFVGSLSSGKTTIARIFARSLLCENRKEDYSPCNVCPSCKSFLDERNPAYTEIDAATSGGKEDVKELFEALNYESVAKRRIILFDECHNMSKEAKDTLLKRLEQNNDNLTFIFCTTEAEKMPGTLRSRCLEFQFIQPTESDVVKKLESICVSENLTYDKDALYVLGQASGRYYRFAENKLTLVSYLGDISKENINKVVTVYNEEIANMLISLSYDISESIKICDFLVSRMNIKAIYEHIVRMLIDSIKLKCGCPFESESYCELLKKLGSQYGESLYEILNYILTKNRFNDLTMLQSDLLIMHYKFMRDQFIAPEIKQPKEGEQKKVVKKEIANTLAEINKLPSWQREEAVRELKKQKVVSNDKSKVKETLSEGWSPEKDTSVVRSVSRDPLTPEDFRKQLGGDNG